MESRSLFLGLMLFNYVCSPVECLYAGMIVIFNNFNPILELHKFTFSLPSSNFTLRISINYDNE